MEKDWSTTISERTARRRNIPIALITPLPKGYGSKKTPLGLAKGFGEITPEFFEELSEEEFPGVGL